MTNLVHLLSGKIHGARVTSANLAYEGSLTIPLPLMEVSGIIEFEAIYLWNVTNGSRLQTYAIRGFENSNEICANKLENLKHLLLNIGLRDESTQY